MTRRREWRSSGPFAPSLYPADEHRERAPCSALQGADQAGINAKVADAAGGFGQAIHIVDDLASRRRRRRSATVSATLKNDGRLFNMLMRIENFRSGDAATPATGRAHIWKPSLRMSHTSTPRTLYARVGRCDCCNVIKIENRYIYQYIRKIGLQQWGFLHCCSGRQTIKYPEISTSCLSGGLNG